nr:hypothetical protein [Tanacetum cinerariifolium]
MMLLAQEITQKFSTPTNNYLCTSSNTINQDVIQDGRVDIQTKNAGYDGNGNRNAGRQNTNQAFKVGNGLTRNDESNQIVQRVPQTESSPGKENVQCYNCNEKGRYDRDCQNPRVRDANPSNTTLVTRINELESQMIEGTLMLLDDDEKPLKPSKPMLPSSLNVVSKMADGLVNKDNDSEVKE